MKSVALHNLGCKVNSYEREVMQQMLQEKGYRIVSFDEMADIYIVNTCTVTNIADRKSRQMLHRARALNPDAVVVAVGCYVQTGGEQAALDESIDLAVGNNHKKDIVTILEQFLAEREPGQRAKGQGSTTQDNDTQEDKKQGDDRQTDKKQGDNTQADKEQRDNTQADQKQGDNTQADQKQGDNTQADKKQGDNTQADKEHRGNTQADQKQADNTQADKMQGDKALWRKTLGGGTVTDMTHERQYEEMTLKSPADHTRAYIKIQDGCNQFCSYCIIPYARGRVRSRRAEDILEEVRGLAAAGYQEVVLTGIHISSYGIDFEDEAWEGRPGSTNITDGRRNDYSVRSKLIDLTEKLHGVEGIRRIRLGSLEPRIITLENARRLAALPKLCPHFHLSLQSGCGETLKRMNRRYTPGEYYQSVEILRRVFEHPAITTDVIVGFPGETEEEFEATRAFLEKVRFYEMHVFKYSRRQGTQAASMPCQIPEKTKAQRSGKLLNLEREQSREFRSRYIGKEAEVLFEETKVINGREYQLGYTADYVKIALETSENLSNCLIKIRVTGFLTDEILNSTSTH